MKALLTCILLFYFLHSFCQEEFLNIDFNKKVKKYIIYKTLPKNKKDFVQEAKFKNGRLTELLFNENGILTKEVFKYRDTILIQTIQKQGTDLFTYAYYYDSLNRIIKETYQAKNGKLFSSKTYRYSEDSIIITLVNHQPNSLSKEIKIYNKNFTDLISSEIVYPNDSKLPSSKTYILYNDSKQIRQENIQMNDIDYQDNYIYDSLKKLIQIIRYQNNKIVSKVYKTYSPLGYQSEEFSYFSPKDSILIKSDISTVVNGKSKRSKSLNYFDTIDKDPHRLDKGSGEIIIYNNIGVSEIITITAGKISGHYIVKYKL